MKKLLIKETVNANVAPISQNEWYQYIHEQIKKLKNYVH